MMSQLAMSAVTPPVNGQTTPHDLFVLTDEQILEIEPEPQGTEVPDAAVSGRAVLPSEKRSLSSSGTADASERTGSGTSSPSASRNVGDAAQGFTEGSEPPKWLAEMMADPQAGGEACDFWNGIQRAQSDAKAYRDVFAKPEDARAAAELVRTLDEIDAAFYGRAGSSPEQTSAARMQLAQRMMREDPVAFREIVFAGLKALGQAPDSALREQPGLGAAQPGPQASAAQSPSPAQSLSQAGSAQSAEMAEYRAFEHSANQELERSVGGAIERALSQTLPSLRANQENISGGARHATTLQERLSAAIREDVEASLKGDRQLGEQVAQILSSRRYDDATRAQVVRLINDRGQQLVPAAARRVINEWTQTTLSAHRAQTQTASRSSERAGLAPARTNSAAQQSRPSENSRAPIRPGRLDYRKLSDEQILDL
jgi:hypothetical protein